MSSVPSVPLPTGGPSTQLGSTRLTDAEQVLVVKLLSDPTYFPVEFKTWLKNYIESAGIVITSSQIQGGGGGAGGPTQLPPGVIFPIAADAAMPSDGLPCDGTTRVRTDFPALFGAIGVIWGAGDGSTTFNLPDLRDRALYGRGAKVGLAATEGVAYGSRGGPFHFHNISQTTGSAGAHSHGVSVSGSTGSVGDHQHTALNAGFAESGGGSAALGSGGTTRFIVSNFDNYTAAAGGHNHSFSGSGSTDSQGAHTHVLNGGTSGGYAADTPSYAGIIWAISTGQ